MALWKILFMDDGKKNGKNNKTSYNNQSFVGLEEPTMKLLLNPSASSGQARFGSFFNTMGLS
ncbi:hypothetical protein SAMN05421793_1792 [Epilithonimonas hominis]|uniref:Uncharacterized protein n=1 Tax=Epilithonimonas hominis TaxID=420404 RepID=A0A1H6MIX4_9FLAO|nr:hypothetical protein SAMN05421793_1792 [Epilithonimonas hominis]